MNHIQKVLIVSVITLLSQVSLAAIKQDAVNTNIASFFNKENTTYIISYSHVFQNPISIPKGCEIIFQGGSLKGPITFNDTKLLGSVNLRGSVISGTVSNSVFEADWICYKDGIHDDAANINMMIEVCGNAHFASGRYRLISQFDPPQDMGNFFRNMICSHIGIHKSNVSLIGEPGALFETDQPLGMICVYSVPRKIEESICHIKIEGLSFHTENNGIDFYETMHTIKCVGVNDFIVQNCYINDFWGDAICLGHFADYPESGELIRNSHVVIRDNIIIGGAHYSTRNGVGVAGGYDVLIDNNYIKCCARNDMPGAIDIEANNSVFTVNDITISNNTILDCGGTAGGICINANKRGGQAHNIKVLYNNIKNCSYGLAFVVESDNTTDSYVIQGNIVDEDTIPYIFVGNKKSSNWIFKDNIFGRNSSIRIPGNIKVSNLICSDNIIGKTTK